MYIRIASLSCRGIASAKRVLSEGLQTYHSVGGRMILPCWTSPVVVTRIRDSMQSFSRMGSVEQSCRWTRKAAWGGEQSFRKFRQNEPIGNFLKFQANDWIGIKSVFPVQRLPLWLLILQQFRKWFAGQWSLFPSA